MSQSISTLVAIRWSSNIGYAIAPLERLFYDTAVQLAGGDTSRVHFMYRDLATGRPRALPDSFANVHAHDVSDRTPAGLQRARAIAEKARPDLLITFDMQPEHPVYRVLRQAGVRSIVSYWGAPISSIMPRWKLLAKQLLLSVSRSRLDGLVFESQAMADFAIKGRGVPPGMIDIVPLGVDVGRFAPAASDHVYRAFDIPRRKHVVVYAGHCTLRKGIQTLVNTAVELLRRRGRDDVCFLACGNTGNESEPYEAELRANGVHEGFLFAGYRPDMVEIYQSALCGFIPSSGWDSFPRSAVEMAATGLPVVASRLHGLAEAVLDRRTGLLFTPGAAVEAADCIERLLDEPELAARLGRGGRERCEHELNLETQCRRFMAAVARHLPTPRSGAAVLVGSESA